jgi:proteic killer suppression protein
LFHREVVREFANIASVARRRLFARNNARALPDLLIPPGNRLEALQSDREGQHSIRINDQYRVCFTWKEDGPHDVEITKHYR